MAWCYLERLSKPVRYGVLEKVSYPEVPPRVESSPATETPAVR